jgi:hypothetical protein
MTTFSRSAKSESPGNNVSKPLSGEDFHPLTLEKSQIKIKMTIRIRTRSRSKIKRKIMIPNQDISD